MELQSVNSSQIAQVGHEGDKLQVLFRRGGLYEYNNVTSAEFEEMMNAESLGSYFSKHIKGTKQGVKLEGTEWPAKQAEPTPEPVKQVAQAAPVAPEDQNQEIEKVARKSSLLVQNAANIRVIDQVTQRQASDFLLAIKAMRGEIADFFKPMKEAAFQAHRVVCTKEKEQDAPLAEAETKVKGQIGSFIAEQQRLAREAEAAARAAEMERALIEAEKEAQRQAIEDAVTLEAQGDMVAAEAVLNNPAPAPVRYVAPAPVAAAVAQVSGITTREDWDFRVINEAAIPREYLLINESAIRALGKTTKGRARIAGIEFFAKQVVSASRGR